MDWDAVYAEYRPLVQGATSLGRFYKLLSAHARMLQDGHTSIYSLDVCNTPLRQRPPLFWHDTERGALGVCVTPLEDDTLLVYRAEADNPAGLAPGDRLVGYDGQPWRELLAEIDTSGIPWCGFWASADSAEDSTLMTTLVNNPHLFSTLDYLPHGSDTSVSVSTDELLTYQSYTLCNDQVAREDVAFPSADWLEYQSAEDHISYGVVEGDVGVVYAYAWGSTEIDPFREAVAALMEVPVRGIVIDHRFNLGGGTGAALDGLDLLFDEPVERIMNCAVRDADSDDITALDINSWGWHEIDPDPDTVFDGPIAVLTGPRSISAGDLLPYYLSFYDNVRRFGQPTNGSFGSISTLWSADDPTADLYAAYTYAICVDADLNYLQGAEIEPEESVWLDPDGVAAGEDAVFEAALRWIDEETQRQGPPAQPAPSRGTAGGSGGA